MLVIRGVISLKTEDSAGTGLASRGSCVKDLRQIELMMFSVHDN
jgi:hypothetical protein